MDVEDFHRNTTVHILTISNEFLSGFNRKQKKNAGIKLSGSEHCVINERGVWTATGLF